MALATNFLNQKAVIPYPARVGSNGMKGFQLIAGVIRAYGGRAINYSCAFDLADTVPEQAVKREVVNTNRGNNQTIRERF